MRTLRLALLLALATAGASPYAGYAGEMAVETADAGGDPAQGDVNAVTSVSPDAVTGASPDATTGASKVVDKADLDGEIGNDDPFGLAE